MNPNNEDLGYRSPIEGLVDTQKQVTKDEQDQSTLKDVLDILKSEMEKLDSFSAFKAVGDPDLKETILGHQKAYELLGNARTRIEAAIERVTDKENS